MYKKVPVAAVLIQGRREKYEIYETPIWDSFLPEPTKPRKTLQLLCLQV